MEFPDNVKYTKEHEWVRVEDDGSVTIGITDYAQQQLGDIVYVELPEVGEDPIVKDAPFAVVESVKAVSDVYAPLSGEIVEVNKRLEKEPQLVNSSPYGDGWMVKLKLSEDSEREELLSADAYAAHIGE